MSFKLPAVGKRQWKGGALAQFVLNNTASQTIFAWNTNNNREKAAGKNSVYGGEPSQWKTITRKKTRERTVKSCLPQVIAAREWTQKINYFFGCYFSSPAFEGTFQHCPFAKNANAFNAVAGEKGQQLSATCNQWGEVPSSKKHLPLLSQSVVKRFPLLLLPHLLQSFRTKGNYEKLS